MSLAALIILLVMVWASPASAGLLFPTWTEPTTNTDGSQITNLDHYRIYYGPNINNVTPCQAAATVQDVIPTTSIPAANSVTGGEISGLTQGVTYFVSITAVNSAGGESACSAISSGVARANATKVLVTLVTGSGTVSGEGSYPVGTTVNPIATPNAGFAFAGWTGGGCTGQGACSITLNTNQFVRGTFVVGGAGPLPPTGLTFGGSTQLLLTASVIGSGTVTASGITCGTGNVPDCTQHYPVSTVVPLTATPGAGGTFTGWGGACTGTGACSVTMTTAQSVTATFTAAGTPYPPSAVIINIAWDFAGAVLHQGQGSDLWPTTWLTNDSLVTAYGDGGGFNGSNNTCRAHFGMHTVTGTPTTAMSFANTWGCMANGTGCATDNGAPSHSAVCDATSGGQAAISGVPDGIVAVGNTLYTFLTDRGELSDTTRLWTSSDGGQNWTSTSVVFTHSGTDFAPTGFVQYGAGYSFNPNGTIMVPAYLYTVGGRIGNVTKLYLSRVPLASITTPSAWEWYNPTTALWGTLAASDFIFQDPAAVGNTGPSSAGTIQYLPSLNRYLLIHMFGTVQQMHVFDGPNPWGPWTTAYYNNSWGPVGSPYGASNGLTNHIIPKFLSADNTSFWMQFSGFPSPIQWDNYNRIQATMTVVRPQDPGSPVIGTPTIGATTTTYPITWATSGVPTYQYNGGYSDSAAYASTATNSLNMVLPNRGVDSNAYLCVQAQDANGVLSVGQSCTGFFVPAANTNIQAAGCSQQNILDAVALAVDGQTIDVPAGSCTWTGTLTINKAITLKGAGTPPAAPARGASTVVGQQTIIRDGMTRASGAAVLLAVNIPTGADVFRLSGFIWQPDGIQGTSDSMITLNGCSIAGANYRIDHNTFQQVNSNNVVRFFGNLYGVIDANEAPGGPGGAHLASTNNLTWPRNDVSCSGQWGDGSWAFPLTPGTIKAHYVENNAWAATNDSGTIIDSAFGGRAVVRNNDIYNTFVGSHGTDSTDRFRGSRWLEVYDNLFHFNAGVAVNQIVWVRGGSGVVFRNDVDMPDRSVGFTWYVKHLNLRSNDPDFAAHNFTPWYSPTGVGPACDGLAQWDGNVGPGSCAAGDTTCVKGYRCLDQPGAGTSVDFNDVTSTAGLGAAGNAYEPIYVWENKIKGVADNCGNQAFSCGTDGVVRSNITGSCVGGLCDIIYGTGAVPQTNGTRPGYTPLAYPHPLVTP